MAAQRSTADYLADLDSAWDAYSFRSIPRPFLVDADPAPPQLDADTIFSHTRRGKRRERERRAAAGAGPARVPSTEGQPSPPSDLEAEPKVSNNPNQVAGEASIVSLGIAMGTAASGREGAVIGGATALAWLRRRRPD
jgi:hypothetical protein